MTGQSPYISLALDQMPRLLSRMDRENPSKTFGCFDRTFWGWKFTDFAGSRFQEALYAMTWFYSHEIEENLYYKNPKILSWILAGLRYWQTLQHNDGSLDEAYPFERSLAATAFTSFYLGEAFLIIEQEIPAELKNSLIKTFFRCADWLCTNDEHHGVLSNHLAVAAAALEIISRISKEQKYSKRGQYFINRILSCQSSEGWYEEYGGADFGYQTHGTFYLARYWQLTKDETLLQSLKKANEFIAYFVHPNHTLGGEYGSRNTSFYFPAGYEILAPVCDKSKSIALFMRESVKNQRAAGLDMMDSYNFCPLLNNYLFAADAEITETALSRLPFMEDNLHIEFPKAGLLVHISNSYQAIFAPSKGGVVKVYDKNKNILSYSDCGYWAEIPGNKKISSQSFSLDNKAAYDASSASVVTPFARIKQKVMSPVLFMGFRAFTLTVGRHKALGLFIKQLLVKILVSGRATSPCSLTRKIEFTQTTVKISDSIDAPADYNSLIFMQDAKFSTIHMGSARYYQPDELGLGDLITLKGYVREFIWKAS